jgi:hypothetical protein
MAGRARNRVFVSYSREDKRWLKRLQVHLKPLERDVQVDLWDDTRIKAGAEWKSEIESALASAGVAVLLVSADFLASDFITTEELPKLLTAAEKDGATIIPVIVSPSQFLDSPLARFQSVNPPERPLIDLPKAKSEAFFADAANAVRSALTDVPHTRRELTADEPSLPDQVLDLAVRVEQEFTKAWRVYDTVVELAQRLQRRAALPLAYGEWSAEERCAIGRRNASSMAMVATELQPQVYEAQHRLNDVEPAIGELAVDLRDLGLDPRSVGAAVSLLNNLHGQLRRGASLLDELLRDLRGRQTNVWLPISRDLAELQLRLDAAEDQVYAWWSELGLPAPFPRRHELEELGEP